MNSPAWKRFGKRGNVHLKNCAYPVKNSSYTPANYVNYANYECKKKENAMTPSDKCDKNLIYFVLFPAASEPKSEFW